MRLGQTNTTLYVVLRDPLSGEAKPGLAAADAVVGYVRPGSAPVWNAAAALDSPSAAFLDYGFIAVDADNLPGVYRVDVPDAAFVAGVKSVAIAVRPAAAAFAPIIGVEELADSPSPLGMAVLRDETSAPATGLTYADVQVGYIRAGSDPVWNNAAELASPTAAYVANGFCEIDAATLPGLYRVDWPAAALAAGVDRVLLLTGPVAGGFAATVSSVELVDATILPAAGEVLTDIPFGDPAAPQLGEALLAQEIPMSVKVTQKETFQVVETIETNMDMASDANVTLAMNASRVLDAASTPPATKSAFFKKALVDGASSIDLTALAGPNAGVVDGTGLRVQAIKLSNPAANANPITIAKGAAAGYAGLGAAFSLTLAPGAEVTLFNNDAGADIGVANKSLDLTGTGTQALSVGIVLG
jgi:hypothetical protein